jgi:hypothetical protein
MTMAPEVRLLALATLAAALAGAAPALKGFSDNFDSQYSHRAPAIGKHASVKEIELKTAERKDVEANRHDEAETRTSLQASQLQFLFTYYIWMEICAERFSQFDGTKAGLREILKSKESDLPPEQVDSIWNAAAEKFQQLEGVLYTSGDTQLHSDCDQNSRYVEGLLALASRTGGRAAPILRRKDF